DSMQTCIGVASSALVAVTIGMAAPGLAEAAGTTVNPVQTTTYTLTSGANPTTFGPNTSINTSSGDAVDGDTSAQWDVTNQGSLKGAASGVVLQSTSTLTNSGAITGVTGDGVDLVAGGAVTNQTKGTISGAVYGVRLSGPGTVTNAGTITGGTGSVKFEGAGANLLDLQTGSTLVGDAFASTAVGATNTLKLEGKG